MPVKFRPVFKGFTIQLDPFKDGLISGTRAANSEPLSQEVVLQRREAVKQAATHLFESKCSLLLELPLQDYNYDLLELVTSELSIAQAWELTYRLRQELTGVVYVEPRFAFTSAMSSDGTSAKSALMKQDPLPGTDRPEWSLEKVHVLQAWKEFFKDGKPPGQGIVIGHPDTGYFPHPELIDFNQYLGSKSANSFNQLIADTTEGINQYQSDLKDVTYTVFKSDAPLTVKQWHGLATSSLMVSPPESLAEVVNTELNNPTYTETINQKLPNSLKSGLDNFAKSPWGQKVGAVAKKQLELLAKQPKKLVGVAHGATLLSYSVRSTEFDEEIFSPMLAVAINRAVKQGASVLSLSVGGIPNIAVRRAIVNAQKQGVIVIASAGNSVPFVPWPAAYDQVIAVASSTVNQTIAQHSAKGSRVTVAAPGESVWCAMIERSPMGITFTTKQLSGTSFATPIVAGIAALWLSHWGKEFLAEKYGLERIPLVFDLLLRKTCTVPDDWDTQRCGAGIVNAHALLKADLPDKHDPAIQVPIAFSNPDQVQIDRGGIETIAYLFEETLSDPTFIRSLMTKAIETLNHPQPCADVISDPRQAVEYLLSQLFHKTGKDLRMYLRTLGQELSFHLASNIELYALFKTTLQAIAGLGTTNAVQAIERVREALKQNCSDALKRCL